MVAALRADLHREARKLAAELGGDPVAAVAMRHVVLRLAGDHAIHAADALARVDDHPKAGGISASFTKVTKLLWMLVPPISGVESLLACVVELRHALRAAFRYALFSILLVWPKP